MDHVNLMGSKARKVRRALDIFYMTTKKGYDDYYWIFVIVAGPGIVTKLFGIDGAAAAIIAFICFYILGRLAIRREKRFAEEKLEREKASRAKRKS
jgi:hypothetical protein